MLGHTRSAVFAALAATFLAGCSVLDSSGPALRPLTCAAPATFADGKTPSAVRHVAVSGDDNHGDGSADRPFRSIPRAAQDIAPGTAIHIHAGTYDGDIALADLRGSAASPIWIAGAPGEPRPTIDGGHQGLYLTRPRYVVLDRLEVANTADNGINVDDGDEVENAQAARFLVFRDLDIHDTGRQPAGVADCLKMAGVNDFVVVNSRFARCGRDENSGAVGVGGVGTHHGIVTGSVFKDNGFGGVQFKGGATDVEIIGNRFEDAGARAVQMGGRTGGQFFRPPLTAAGLNHEAARIDVTGNVFVGGEASVAFVGCVDCGFTRNTVVNPSRWAARILQETVFIDRFTFAPASRGIINGNLFYFRRADLNTGSDINVGNNTESASFALSDNVWYAHDAPDRSAPLLSEFHGAQWGTISGVATSFADASRGDYRVPSHGDDYPPGTPVSCSIPD